MTKITIICGFGVISVIDFRDDIVRKVSDFMPGANLGEIKVRTPAEYSHFEDVSQKHLKGAIYDNSPKGELVRKLMFEKNPKKLSASGMTDGARRRRWSTRRRRQSSSRTLPSHQVQVKCVQNSCFSVAKVVVDCVRHAPISLGQHSQLQLA